MAFKKNENKATVDMNNVEVTGTIKNIFVSTPKYTKGILTINKEKGFVNVVFHYFGDMTDKKEGNTLHIGGEIDTIKNEYKGNVTYTTAIRVSEYE